MGSEIKPCPFCGGQGFPVDNDGDARAASYVECRDCEVWGPIVDDVVIDYEWAIAAWNRRANEGSNG